MEPMKHSESERSGYREREGVDWAEGVHIRQKDRGVMSYAVFDGEERVSVEYGPLDEEFIINFARGYSKAKERYEDG